MRAEDRGDFADLMSKALAFYRQDVTEYALDVWWSACQGFELEQVGKALTAHAMDPEQGRFPPMPSDVVRALQGTHTDRALLAWGRVLAAMSGIGAYSDVDFGDGAIHQAIMDAGGWSTICRTVYDELPFVQRRFCDSYRAYSKRDTSGLPVRLLGLHSAENAVRGLAGAELVRMVGSIAPTPLAIAGAARK